MKTKTTLLEILNIIESCNSLLEIIRLKESITALLESEEYSAFERVTIITNLKIKKKNYE